MGSANPSQLTTAIYDELTGTSTHSYANTPTEPRGINRAERRAMVAAERKATKRFNRQIRDLVKAGIYGDDE